MVTAKKGDIEYELTDTSTAAAYVWHDGFQYLVIEPEDEVTVFVVWKVKEGIENIGKAKSGVTLLMVCETLPEALDLLAQSFKTGGVSKKSVATQSAKKSPVKKKAVKSRVA